MLRRALQLTGSPRALLRSVLALDDSPHAIALGVAIGVFVGLTPSVGVQTIMILAVVFLTRPFFYFNGTAAMASTYISNPITMAPMYYFWYRLGASVMGTDANVNFDALLEFEGLSGWWTATTALAVKVGWPMLLGALMTAPIGAAIAYPLTHYLISSLRKNRSKTDGHDTSESAGDTSADRMPADERSAEDSGDRGSTSPSDTDPNLDSGTLDSTPAIRRDADSRSPGRPDAVDSDSVSVA
ncbi:MAG: DUF2062 domain-containing protein [Planctomycetaceae bacterium]|nr:DUF2062 domain-containing protein [Planctomycetaceae bacterium]